MRGAELQKRYGTAFSAKVAVTATTGIAATHVQGTTINAALGIGAPSMAHDFAKMFQNKDRVRAYEVGGGLGLGCEVGRTGGRALSAVWPRCLGLQVLVVDECSMMSAEMLEHLDRSFRHAHKACSQGHPHAARLALTPTFGALAGCLPPPQAGAGQRQARRRPAAHPLRRLLSAPSRCFPPAA